MAETQSLLLMYTYIYVYICIYAMYNICRQLITSWLCPKMTRQDMPAQQHDHD